MPGEQDKQVKLSFVVDEPSVQRARQALSSLITDATNLANILKQTSVGGGGGGGGGGGLSIPGVANQSLLGGGYVGGQPQNSQQVLAMQNPAQRITNALAENGQALKGLAQGSADALRTMSDALRRSVDEQERTVAGLQTKLAGLLKTYQELGSGRGIGPLTEEQAQLATPLGQRRLAAAIEDTAKEADTQGRRLSNLKENHETLTGAGGGLVDPKAPSGGGGGLMQALRWGAVAGGAQGLLSTVGNIAGSVASAAELQPGRMAARGQVFGDMYQRAYAGDWTVGAVMGALGGDPRFGGAGWGQDATSLGNANVSTGISRVTGAAAGLIPGANLLTGGYNPVAGVAGAAFVEQDMQTQQLQNFRKLAADYEASAGVPLETAIRSFQSQVGGNIGLERALGISGRTRWGGNAKELEGGRLARGGFAGMNRFSAADDAMTVDYKDKLADLTYRLATHGGYTTEEFASAVGPLRQSLGTRGAYAGNLAGLVMGGEAGGFMGIGGLGAAAGIGGSAPEFLRAVMGMSRGGRGFQMSEAAAMGIGGGVASGLFGGGIATSGLGMLGALTSGLGAGGGGAQDLIIAQQAQRGLSAFGGYFSGQTSPYTAGVNFLNAGGAFGQTGFAAQGALSTLFGKNPDLAADIAAGGPVPAEVMARLPPGTSQDQARAEVKKFLNMGMKQQIALAASYVSGESEEGRMLRAVRDETGGDVKAYAQQHHIRAHSKAGQRLRTLLGAGLADAGSITGVADTAAGEGEVGLELGLGARGAHLGAAGAAQSASRKAIAEDADRVHKNATDIAGAMGAILTSVVNTKNAIDPLKGIVTDITKDASGFDDAIKLMTVSMLEAAAEVNPKYKPQADALMKEFNKRHTQVRTDTPVNTEDQRQMRTMKN